MPTWLVWTLRACAFMSVGAVVLFFVARLLARQAVRTAIERARADQAFEAAKKEEQERAAQRTREIEQQQIAEAEAIERMDSKELESEINK